MFRVSNSVYRKISRHFTTNQIEIQNEKIYVGNLKLYQSKEELSVLRKNEFNKQYVDNRHRPSPWPLGLRPLVCRYRKFESRSGRVYSFLGLVVFCVVISLCFGLIVPCFVCVSVFMCVCICVFMCVFMCMRACVVCLCVYVCVCVCDPQTSTPGSLQQKPKKKLHS